MLDIKKINKLAIFSGNDDLPKKIIDQCLVKNIDFILVGIKGNSDKKLINKYNNFWVSFGEVQKTIDLLKKNNVTHICFAGRIKRPSLFSLKFDNLGKKLLKRFFKSISGDNSLLSILVQILEEYNFQVIGVQELDDSILSFIGNYSKKEPDINNWYDIIYGFDIAKKIGELDIGQGVIVQQKIIVAVEGVEGTDNLMKRSKKLLKKCGTGGILIKTKKPNQEIRADLPTIGLKTLILAKKNGLIGIVIEAGGTLVLNKEQIIKYSNKYNIFVISVSKEILQQKMLEISDEYSR